MRRGGRDGKGEERGSWWWWWWRGDWKGERVDVNGKSKGKDEGARERREEKGCGRE